MENISTTWSCHHRSYLTTGLRHGVVLVVWSTAPSSACLEKKLPTLQHFVFSQWSEVQLCASSSGPMDRPSNSQLHQGSLCPLGGFSVPSWLLCEFCRFVSIFIISVDQMELHAMFRVLECFCTRPDLFFYTTWPLIFVASSLVFMMFPAWW